MKIEKFCFYMLVLKREFNFWFFMSGKKFVDFEKLYIIGVSRIWFSNV